MCENIRKYVKIYTKIYEIYINTLKRTKNALKYVKTHEKHIKILKNARQTH